MTAFTEFVVEEATLAWLESRGCAIKHGPDISLGGDTCWGIPDLWQEMQQLE